jgi:hypothetical protein
MAKEEQLVGSQLEPVSWSLDSPAKRGTAQERGLVGCDSQKSGGIKSPQPEVVSVKPGAGQQ